MLLGRLNSRAVCAVIMLTAVVVGELVAPAEAVITRCGQVISFLTPCIGYLKHGGSVPGRCCNGVRGLVAAARTRADRQLVCNCLKGAYRGYRGIKLPNAQSLPARCGANVRYTISPTTDCSRVN